MTAHPARLTLDLPCTHRAVRTGRRALQSVARTEDLADEEIERLMLVASELLANAVDHGGGGGAFTEADLDRPVRMGMTFELSAAGWTLEVEDQGGDDGRALTALLDEGAPFDLEDERGRGLFLVRDMVETMRVRPGAAGLVVAVTRDLGGG